MAYSQRSRVKSKYTFEAAEINLTALIDIVFTVLIMFILIAPLIDLDHVQLAAKGDKTATKNPQEVANSVLVIHVHADNTIWYKQTNLQPQQLTEVLKRIKQNYPGVIPQIIHDKRATFGTYQMVKNAAEAAGFSSMDVILEP